MAFTLNRFSSLMLLVTAMAFPNAAFGSCSDLPLREQGEYQGSAFVFGEGWAPGSHYGTCSLSHVQGERPAQVAGVQLPFLAGETLYHFFLLVTPFADQTPIQRRSGVTIRQERRTIADAPTMYEILPEAKPILVRNLLARNRHNGLSQYIEGLSAQRCVFVDSFNDPQTVIYRDGASVLTALFLDPNTSTGQASVVGVLCTNLRLSGE